MGNFDLQNNKEEIKTLDELVKETFSAKKPIIDLSFFYDEKKEQENRDNRHTDILFPSPNRQ